MASESSMSARSRLSDSYSYDSRSFDSVSITSSDHQEERHLARNQQQNRFVDKKEILRELKESVERSIRILSNGADISDAESLAFQYRESRSPSGIKVEKRHLSTNSNQSEISLSQASAGSTANGSVISEKSIESDSGSVITSESESESETIVHEESESEDEEEPVEGSESRKKGFLHTEGRGIFSFMMPQSKNKATTKSPNVSEKRPSVEKESRTRTVKESRSSDRDKESTFSTSDESINTAVIDEVKEFFDKESSKRQSGDSQYDTADSLSLASSVQIQQKQGVFCCMRPQARKRQFIQKQKQESVKESSSSRGSMVSEESVSRSSSSEASFSSSMVSDLSTVVSNQSAALPNGVVRQKSTESSEMTPRGFTRDFKQKEMPRSELLTSVKIEEFNAAKLAIGVAGVMKKPGSTLSSKVSKSVTIDSESEILNSTSSSTVTSKSQSTIRPEQEAIPASKTHDGPVRHRKHKKRMHRLFCWAAPGGRKKSFLFPDQHSDPSSGEEETMDGGKYAIVGYSVHSYHNPINQDHPHHRHDKNGAVPNGHVASRDSTLSRVVSNSTASKKSKRKKPLPDNVGAEAASRKKKPWLTRICGCNRVKVRSHSTQTPYFSV